MINLENNPARAWVHAGAHQTEYARAGAGRAVILLASDRALHATAQMLFDALRPSMRVLWPEPPLKECAQLDYWLPGFLDALGLADTSIIALPDFGVPALHFALAEPERVERLVLLLPTPANGEELEPRSDFLTRRAMPVHVLPMRNAAAAVEQVAAVMAMITHV